MRLLLLILFLNLTTLVLTSQNDTITIHYAEKYCCGGICCEYEDMIELIKTENGQYFATYFDSIADQICFEREKHTILKKLLGADKNNLVLEFITNHTTTKKKRRIIYDGTVIIWHKKTYYIKRNSSYRDFREKLLN